MEREMVGWITAITIGLIRVYQRLISPIMPQACRFYPSCSEYMRQAILKHGILPGVWMGIKRIARCHPWNVGGQDPVP